MILSKYLRKTPLPCSQTLLPSITICPPIECYIERAFDSIPLNTIQYFTRTWLPPIDESSQKLAHKTCLQNLLPPQCASLHWIQRIPLITLPRNQNLASTTMFLPLNAIQTMTISNLIIITWPIDRTWLPPIDSSSHRPCIYLHSLVSSWPSELASLGGVAKTSSRRQSCMYVCMYVCMYACIYVCIISDK